MLEVYDHYVMTTGWPKFSRWSKSSESFTFTHIFEPWTVLV